MRSTFKAVLALLGRRPRHVPGALVALLFCSPAFAAQLLVEVNGQSRYYSSAELLTDPRTQRLSIPEDVSYKRAMSFQALPLAALLEGVAADAHLQLVASDGFAAELPVASLLQKSASRAWLAVEDPAAPWPPLAPGKASAGPFYLVWSDPQASGIGAEQWPFQLAAIRQLSSLAERFPALLPAPGLAADDPVNLGFAQFQKHCLACHRLNGQGDARIAPDLNLPYSPTEYFRGDFLARYIRDPQSLRQWPQGRMPGFSPAQLSDADLARLIAYLRHMAGRKVGDDAATTP